MPKKSKILIVDDLPANILVLQQTLEDVDADIISASSGQEALKVSLNHHFAVMILDVQMPDMDGYELAELFRSNKNTQEIPIIFLSAVYSTEYSVIKGFQTGAVDFLSKPINPKIIVNKVNCFIQMDQNKKAAEIANKAKSQFLANLTHDIRTPLNAILGFNEILVEQSKKLALPGDFHEYLDNIQINSQHLLELVNNFLDISKIEAGKMGLSEESFNLADVIDNLSKIQRFITKEKGVVFSYEIDNTLPDIIRSDRSKLTQILTNLVNNAIKFTPKDKAVTLKISKEQNTLVFKVTDQGIGISQQYQHTIFNAFDQGSESINKKYGGTGLGLVICKELATMLGGTVTVVSQGMDQGACFTLTIPFKEGVMPAMIHQQATSNNSGYAKECCILVVDDNMMNRRLFQAMLKRLKLQEQIQFAENGQEALDKTLQLVAADTAPDIIFMDMQMPVMDGLEATRKIRQNQSCQDIPIIALSANALKEHKKEALASGMNDYLAKPIDFLKLTTVLERYLKKA